MMLIAAALWSKFTLAQANNKLLETERALINVYKDTSSSVVNVSNIEISQDFLFDVPQKREAGTGSGFIWDNQGHIVTNFHVVQNEKNTFQINFFNGNEPVKAKIVGVEPKLDIAVLKVDKLPSNVKPINTGKSSSLQVGQFAIAIGSPFGLDQTMTVGVISALGRKITGIAGVKIANMIQTDADINPGNSGGPLINSQGELIGMNTMIFSSSGSSAGLGFAVPVDSIIQVVPDLIKHGKVIRPALGISPLPEYYQQNFLLDSNIKGVIVAYVIEGSAAQRAGIQGMSRDQRGRIKLGDIIISIENKEVSSLDDIFQIINTYKIGDNVNVKVRRNSGDIKTLSIKLQSM